MNIYGKAIKKYQNETGIYNQEEVCKNLAITSKIQWNNIGPKSLSAYCKKVPTAFLGIIENEDDNQYTWINKIYFGVFIDPQKGSDFLKYMKQHINKKDIRRNNKYDANYQQNLEEKIKQDKNIQAFLKNASNEQKQLLIDTVNKTQKGDFKILADTNFWVFKETPNNIRKDINNILKSKDDKNVSSSLKLYYKNFIKLCRYHVMSLLCQTNEKTLKNDIWFNRLNKEQQKDILNIFNKLHNNDNE